MFSMSGVMQRCQCHRAVESSRCQKEGLGLMVGSEIVGRHLLSIV